VFGDHELEPLVPNLVNQEETLRLEVGSRHDSLAQNGRTQRFADSVCVNWVFADDLWFGTLFPGH
jgi:hypothetical protein